MAASHRNWRIATADQDTTYRDGVSTYARCNILLARGQFRDAKEAALAGLSEDPNNAYLLSALARSLRGMEDPVQAHKFAEQAVAIEPHDSELMAELAYMQRACNASAKAVETARAARALDPTSRFAMLVSVDILLSGTSRRERASMILEAREVADAGMLAHPNSCAVHVADGHVHLAQKQVTAAEVSARRALNIDPNDAAALTLLAAATAEQGRTHEASDYYVQAGRADPTSNDAIDGLRQLSNGRIVFLAVVLILIFVILGSIGGPSFLVLPVLMAASIGAIVFIGDAMTKQSQKRTAARKLSPEAQNILDQDRE